MPKNLDDPNAATMADVLKMPAIKRDGWLTEERERIRNSPQEKAFRALVDSQRERWAGVGDGDDSLERVLIEMHHATGLNIAELLDMGATEFDRFVGAVLRRRGHQPVSDGGKSVPDKSQTIPPDKRTRPMTKKKAARLLGRNGDENRAVEWLNSCIDDGTVRWERRSRQSGVYHIDDFPAAVQGQIKPN